MNNVLSKVQPFIPGFRSNEKWKKIIASVYYLLSLLLAIGGVGIALFFLSIPFLVFSLIGIIKKRGKISLVTCIIAAIVMVAGLGMVPKFTQDGYNDAVKKSESTNKKSTESKVATSTNAGTDSNKKQESTAKASNVINGELKVHFINVGQADSILVQQGNNFMLVDAGNNEDSGTIKSYLDNQGVKELQYFVGTHAHEDHIGSAAYIINSFKVGKIYFPKQTATTKTFEEFVNAAKARNGGVTAPNVGDTFMLGDAKCTVIAPNKDKYEDANDYSIVLKVEYGSTSFLLTGDAESQSESEILAKGLDISATVLKVGHHGSKTSTSQDFLNKVNPKYAVISVGKGNSYGHPTQETLDRLKAKNIPIYRTDENGNIVATSDGKEVEFSTNPGSYTGVVAKVENNNKSNTTNTSNSGSNTANPNNTTNNNSSNSTSNNVVSTPSTSNNTAPPKTDTPATNGDNNRIVYYVPNGKSYHYDKNCSTLKRSKTILEGKLQDVINMGKSDPCDKCVH